MMPMACFRVADEFGVRIIAAFQNTHALDSSLVYFFLLF